MDDLVLKVKLVPRSSVNKIVGMEGDSLKVKVKAAPLEGLANKDLVTLLSKRLKISKDTIKIVSGRTSRLKICKFHDIKDLKVFEILKNSSGHRFTQMNTDRFKYKEKDNQR